MTKDQTPIVVPPVAKLSETSQNVSPTSSPSRTDGAIPVQKGVSAQAERIAPILFKSNSKDLHTLFLLLDQVRGVGNLIAKLNTVN